MKSNSVIFFMAALMLPFLVGAATLASPKDNLTVTLNQLRSAVVDLKNSVQNHESEIRTFEEKLQTQESGFESLRDQLTSTSEEQSIQLKNNNVNLESKITALETTLNGLTADLRTMKNQSNDSVAVLAQYKQKLGEIEKIIDAQNQHMGQMENAMKSMMAVLQNSSQEVQPIAVNTSINSSTGNIYKVQPGDTLEKIARKNNTTAKALKEANSLANDRIVVGQALKIP